MVSMTLFTRFMYTVGRRSRCSCRTIWKPFQTSLLSSQCFSARTFHLPLLHFLLLSYTLMSVCWFASPIPKHWPRPATKMSYSPLSDKFNHESQSEDHEGLLSREQTTYPKRPRRSGMLWCILSIPLISLCSVIFGAWIGSRFLVQPGKLCPEYVQHYCMTLRMCLIEAPTNWW